MGLFPELSEALITRLDVAGPRYTSYPTVPEWSTDFGGVQLLKAYDAAAGEDGPLGLYMHIPFCEERCTFCGCNVVITKQTTRADQYIDYLIKEMDLVVPQLGSRLQVGQLHWGGGTPTFLTEAQIERLFGEITKRFEILPDAEVSIEIDPVVTTDAQLTLLSKLGFNRISMGVQDFDPEVQAIIHRIQSVEETREMVDHARSVGFGGVNFDLIYGLPLQTPEKWARTLEQVIELSPDRLAVYSFAYLPDLRKHQKRLPIADVPTGLPKMQLFQMAYDAFTEAGYHAIGMDHFAKPEDELSTARGQRNLHRNFQGYSARPGTDTVAFGVTAISDVQGRYAQSVPQIAKYYQILDEGRLPTVRGLELDAEDLKRRTIINQLMCNFWVDLGPNAKSEFAEELEVLQRAEYTDLCTISGTEIELTALGEVFVRNVAMVLDPRLKKNKHRFSRTV